MTEIERLYNALRTWGYIDFSSDHLGFEGFRLLEQMAVTNGMTVIRTYTATGPRLVWDEEERRETLTREIMSR